MGVWPAAKEGQRQMEAEREEGLPFTEVAALEKLGRRDDVCEAAELG